MIRTVLGKALLLFLAASPTGFYLSDDVRPSAYSVSLRIDPAKDTFEGSMKIDVDLRHAQSSIWLNAKELTVTAASAGADIAHTELVDDEFLKLQFDKPIGPGRATLAIEYRAKLREKPTVGAFHTRFEHNWYAFTTFTAIDARRAFPCFDEPRFKAEWELTLHIPQQDKAFSNMPELDETAEEGGTKAIHFQRTLPFASEVIAFAVGPFDVLPAGDAGGEGTVAVRVIAPAGHAAEGADAGSFTKQVVERLEKYTGIPFPWSKLDHLALPEGTFGGVEQPGLITYRLKALLRKPGMATPEQDRALNGLLTHELAHQWFGNLVTQSTWEDVWLSEGFATWLTNRLTDTDSTPARRRIMAADAGEKSRPVRLAMNSREEMEGVYSQFVYQKAGAVLLMVEDWLGQQPFRKGLQIYLRTHRNGNASIEDLVAALKKSSGIDTGLVLHSFLDRKGVPEVRAALRCEERKQPVLHVDPTGWTVPVCWTADHSSDCAVFDAKHQDHKLKKCPVSFKLNPRNTGYYLSEP